QNHKTWLFFVVLVAGMSANWAIYINATTDVKSANPFQFEQRSTNFEIASISAEKHNLSMKKDRHYALQANSWEDYYIESASMDSTTIVPHEVSIAVSEHRVSTFGTVSDLRAGEWHGVLGKVNTAPGGQSPCPGWENDGPHSGNRLCRA